MSRAAVLCGVGGWVPPKAVTNAHLSQRLDTSDEWIRSRTGIAQRYFADPGMATSDLAVEAGKLALRSAGGAAVDAVVVATTTPDRPCPATAPEVAWRLGLTGAAAYDIGAVCTGFVYALANAAGLIAAGAANRVLVIGAETFSSIVDPEDRATAVIFGDGAGAVVLRAGDAGEPGSVGPFDLGSDGEASDLLAVRAGGSRQRLSGVEPGMRDHYFSMAGREVFFHAVRRMTASIRTVMDRAGWRMADVDRLVCHQANMRIINQLADDLGLDRSRIVSNISRVGNTAAASIPLALADGVADQTLRAGHRVLLTAFGGGLTWGSTVLMWPCLPNDRSNRHDEGSESPQSMSRGADR
jgi:3-oxoacyl-[acyl-carrier-protein] synthase-3